MASTLRSITSCTSAEPDLTSSAPPHTSQPAPRDDDLSTMSFAMTQTDSSSQLEHSHTLSALKTNLKASPKTSKQSTWTATAYPSSAFSKQATQSIAPFLTEHIPEQYAPLGIHTQPTSSRPNQSNTKFCYRHRPDLKCRRQADEPSMGQLQNVSYSGNNCMCTTGQFL